jgi:hypothetical protein
MSVDDNNLAILILDLQKTVNRDVGHLKDDNLRVKRK